MSGSHEGDHRGDHPDEQPEPALADLLRTAVSEAPASSFDERDVYARYHRERRHRARVLTGAAGVVVAVLVVAGVLTPLLLLGGHGSGGASDGNLAAAPRVSSVSPQRLSPHAQELPGEPSKQGDGSSGRVGPRAGHTRPGCARVDRELATALAGELPVSTAGQAAPVPGGCVTGGRGARLPAHGATISAVVLPAGADPDGFLAAHHASSGQVRQASSGATVVVYLTPPPGSPDSRSPESEPPSGQRHHLLERLPAVADALAGRF